MLKVKSLQISVLTVQKAYDILQEDGFIETTAGKGCKKIEGCLNAVSYTHLTLPTNSRV